VSPADSELRMDGRILMKVEEVDALGSGVVTEDAAGVWIAEEIDVCPTAVFAFFALCLVRRGDRLDSVAEAAVRAAGLFWRTDCFVTRIAFFCIETTRGVQRRVWAISKQISNLERKREGKNGRWIKSPFTKGL
jgi:hypothetical protein